MRNYPTDREKTLQLATNVSKEAASITAWQRLSDPRLLIAAAALRTGVATEKRRARKQREPARDTYLPRSIALSYLQAHRDEHFEAWTATGPAFAEGFHLRYGFDYHWITEFAQQFSLHLRKRIRFNRPKGSPRIESLAEDARIILVGDWGTGEQPAQDVASQMRIEIGRAVGREVHVVHLGDVYYAGTRWEARNRFLKYWPVRHDQTASVRSWCLNGNHDMYSAGEGLYDEILSDGRFRQQRTHRGRKTTEFHLQNNHWDIVGLDTSWKFHLFDFSSSRGHLEPRQRRWLVRRLTKSTRRRMLLTHHEPLTINDDGHAKEVVGLTRATARLRTERAIDAWFWGHDHRLIRFDPTVAIKYGVCMGHGAVLNELPEEKVGLGATEFRGVYKDRDGNEWRMPGFAIIDLDRDRARVTYLDKEGSAWRDPDDI